MAKLSTVSAGNSTAYAPDSATLSKCAELVRGDRTGEGAHYLVKEVKERYKAFPGLLDKPAVQEALSNLDRMATSIKMAHDINSSNVWNGKETMTDLEADYNLKLEELAKAGTEAIGDGFSATFKFAIGKATDFVRAWESAPSPTEAPEASQSEKGVGTHG